MPKVRCGECREYVDREKAIGAGIQRFCSDECRLAKTTRRISVKKQDMSSDAKLAIVEKDGGRCRFCGKKQNLHVHHVIYKSEQGKDTDDNLLTLCNTHHDLVHSDKKLWQPICLTLLWVRETTGNRRMLLPVLKEILEQ